MDKITYFDVEYANSKNKSICQIGILCKNLDVENSEFDSLNIYINPEDGFDENCVKIHGITESKVSGEANFASVWKKIEKYFTNSVIVGHNVASADLDALVKSLSRYNLDIPEIYYVCTYELAKLFVPSFCVANYKLSTLCEYFGIDAGASHDAFDDSRSCSELLIKLISTYNIKIGDYVRKYVPNESYEFSEFISNPSLRKSISEFFGFIRGFTIDNEITDEEINYIKKWRQEHFNLIKHEEIKDIIATIDEIIDDGKITLDEMFKLQCCVKKYLDMVSTAPVTMATQILDGILKGIVVDNGITENECRNLRQWLYDNIYLSNHFPFDKIIRTLDDILADSIITEDEVEYLKSVINDILNPVESLKSQIYSVDGKNICLSGNFSFGSKSEVEVYIVERGGNVESSVKKSTDILIIGDCECIAYSNGTYGTKVKKAMEYNEKGCNIQIVKEKDFFENIK